jgi:hypothetical protein
MIYATLAAAFLVGMLVGYLIGAARSHAANQRAMDELTAFVQRFRL